MNVHELLGDARDMTLPDADATITGLTADSRAVKPGFLFAAIPGVRQDGRAFIADALDKGASVILAPPDVDKALVGDRATLILDANPRRRLAKLAARFHAPQPETAVAVTGTNGKTSTASFTRQIWAGMGLRSASIGTLGVVAPGRPGGPGLTTPDPVHLHATLQELALDGVQHVALEASSHGLDQYRLDGLQLVAAGFTNLTRDHLDYHGSMEAYRASKLRLFEELLPRGGTVVVNTAAAEHDTIAAIAQERGLKLISYGLEHGNLRTARIEARGHGFALELEAMGHRHAVDFPLAGRFQIENALCALGLVIGAGGDPAEAARAMGGLSDVPGRMELVGHIAGDAAVYVDFAHTPDALETVLKTLRPHTQGRLLCAFGCGGDRDPGKRPQMGEVVARLADLPIVTDDNPRSEKPEAIRAQVMAACPGGVEIGDRAEAIDRAIAMLQPGDVLVIAGKGHEQGQTLADRTIPFDDRVVAREALIRRGGQVS